MAKLPAPATKGTAPAKKTTNPPVTKTKLGSPAQPPKLTQRRVR